MLSLSSLPPPLLSPSLSPFSLPLSFLPPSLPPSLSLPLSPSLSLSTSDKCNPPTDIESISGSDSDPFFSLTWSPPTAEQGYAYQVEVYAYNAKDYKSYIYSVNTHQTCITVNMKVEAYSVGRVLELRNEVRIKAISLTTGQTSDYVYIPNIEVKRGKQLLLLLLLFLLLLLLLL